jgi:hypothetical protein
VKLRASLLTGLLATATVAFGVPNLATVATPGTIDDFKIQQGGVVDQTAIGTLLTGAELPAYEATDNIELIAELETGASSDIMFQRREGRQMLDGVEIDAVKDYAFVGTVYASDGFRVVDVTNPREPQLLASVACGGFHNDIVVWENYVVIGHDGGAKICDGQAALGVRPSGAGIWIFDVTDPAKPVLVKSVGKAGVAQQGSELTDATHNISLNPEEGLVLFSTAGFHTAPKWGYFDLKGDILANEPVELSMRDLTRDVTAAADGCHDQGLAFDVETATGDVRDFIFCAAIGTTIIWDITEDATNPVHVATIANPSISIHHGARLAPDGRTLVLNDELAGAAAGSCSAGAPTGTLFAYDISVPEAPVALGYGSAPDLPNAAVCTSHFYNFIAPSEMDGGQQLSVTGWYSGGAIIHDFSRAAGVGPIGVAPVYAQLTPEGVRSWTAYAYRGFIYSASYGGSNTGFFVAEMDGYDAEGAEPQPFDEGTSWSRWTQNEI